MVTLLYVAFVLSGAAGLIYESIWTRYLALFVGHSAYAQVIVLVIFLGGMSIGALAIGHRSERVRRPLLWYVAIELATGVIGLCFHSVYVVTTSLVYARVFPALGLGLAQTLVKWGVAGALILPQSILLGTTFPLMSAGVIRRTPRSAGRALSMLYFSNSIGAAAGVLVAGFYLVQLAGLPGTLRTAAILNLIVGAAVFAALRLPDNESDPSASTEPARVSRAVTGIPPQSLSRLLLAVSFGTALSSFIYEIGWIRMLSLGSATQSFELMLSAFILGLALGAFWIRRWADGAAGSLRVLGLVQLAMGTLAIATLPIYISSFTWMAGFMSAFARTSDGYLAFSVGRYVICLAVMLPATLCAGMTLPLITRLLVSTATGERAIGQVYGVNTLGSILGAALAGLVLLPLVGVKWLLVSGATVDLALGALILALERRRVGTRVGARQFGLGAAGVAALATLVLLSRFDPALLTSGVYRSGVVSLGAPADILYYEDGRTATVSMRRAPGTGALTLATNGKPDASLGPEWMTPAGDVTPGPFAEDAPSQLLVPLVALAHVPDAASAAVIGHGSGMTASTLLASPAIRRVVTIEIEPDIIRASRLFLPANQRTFDDPRSTFVIDDARAYFATQRTNFDLIISEPSNPWVSGVSGLFTTEFYARVAQHLSADGIFAQWLHLYEIDDALVLGVVAAIAQHFPAYAIYAVSDKDILIVASKRGVLPLPEWAVFRQPLIAAELHRVWPITPRTLDQLWIADNVALAPLLRLASVPNSDYYPTLDLNAERTRFLGSEASGFAALNGGPVDLPAIAVGRRSGVGESYAIIAGVAGLQSMAIGAGMRSGDPRAGQDARDAADQYQTFEAQCASGRPPAEWHIWARTLAQISSAREGGMSGVADSAFFLGAMRYAHQQHAPPEATAMVAFLYGLASWNFRAVDDASDVLVAATRRGDPWISVDLLRDGAVIAKLEVGDAAAARTLFDGLARWSARSTDDLRTQLLYAYVVNGSIGGP